VDPLLSDPAVEVRGLVITSGSRVLQRDLDFGVDGGRALALVGESGSGRRALFRSLVGLEAPAEGDVYYSGEALWASSERDRRRLMAELGVVLAGGALLSTKTLLENVALPLEAHTRLSNRDVRSLAHLKLALFGLAGYESHYPTEVDIQRRVCAALARATALDPALLFCEQPTAGLDPGAAAFVRDAIFRARDDMGTTLVVMTNDVAFVLAADEAVFLGVESKTLKARGSPAWLREHAADADVRAFLAGPRA
jgi:phospholipid/cholesterol/gamma-HCH transport system ATP-binding protein